MRPLVIIPGFLAMEIWLDKDRVWPPTGLGWLRLGRLADPRLHEGEPVIEFRPPFGPLSPVLPILRDAMAVLETELGYRVGEDLFFFAAKPFVSLESTSADLRLFIEACYRKVGAPVIVMAAGIGALFARMAVDRMGANAFVERMILLAPADRGIPNVFASLVSAPMASRVDHYATPERAFRRFIFWQYHKSLPDVAMLYHLVPIEPFCSSEGRLIRPHDETGWVQGEGEVRRQRLAWLEAGRRGLEALAVPPTVPTTCVYGSGYPTPDWCFVPSSSGEPNWRAIGVWDGDGDGLLPARHARSADLAAGLEVVWARFVEGHLWQTPAVFDVIRRAVASHVKVDAPDWVGQHVGALRQDDAAEAMSTWEGREVVPIPFDTLHPAADARAVISSARARSTLVIHGDEDSGPSAVGAMWHLAQLWRGPGDPVPLFAELGPDLGPLCADDILALVASGVHGPRTPSASEVAEWLQRSPAVVILLLRTASAVSEVQALITRLRFPAFVILDPDRIAVGAWGGAEVWARPKATQSASLHISVRRDCIAGRPFPVRIEVLTSSASPTPVDTPGRPFVTRSQAVELHWPIDPNTGKVLPLTLAAAVHTEGFDLKVSMETLTLDFASSGMSRTLVRTPYADSARRIWVEFYSGPSRVGGLDAPLYQGGDLHLDTVLFARLRRASSAATLDDDSKWVVLKEALPPVLRSRLAPAGNDSDRLDAALRALNVWPISEGGARCLHTFIERSLEFVGGPERAPFVEALAALNRADAGLPMPRAPLRDRELVMEAVLGGSDLLPITFLERALRAARAVACVEVPRVDGGQPTGDWAYGTAWLIAPGVAITNHHVIHARSPAEAAATDADLRDQAKGAILRFGYDDPQSTDVRVHVTELAYADSLLDFALLRLGPELPGEIAPLPWDAGRVVLDPARPAVANIIQHPGGRAKMVALRNNLMTSATTTELRYFTDTEPGSSGSPVLIDTLVAVGLHRMAGQIETSSTHRAYRYNVGVALAAVALHLSEHAPALWAELSPHCQERPVKG